MGGTEVTWCPGVGLRGTQAVASHRWGAAVSEAPALQMAEELGALGQNNLVQETGKEPVGGMPDSHGALRVKLFSFLACIHYLILKIFSQAAV